MQTGGSSEARNSSGGVTHNSSASMGFGGGDKYGIFMSGGASPTNGGTSGVGASTNSGGSSNGTTYGAGGSKYGMFMSGGTRNSSAGTSNTTAASPGTGGGYGSAVSKYGMLMTGGTTLGNGGTSTRRITSPAADYAVVLLDESKPRRLESEPQSPTQLASAEPGRGVSEKPPLPIERES